MPSFTRLSDYRLSSLQVDLILYALDSASGTMTDVELDEYRKIRNELNSPLPDEDVPSTIDDIYDHYFTCDY